MIHRLFLATFGLLTMATCQNQTATTTTATAGNTEANHPPKTSTTATTPAETSSSEPKMAPGLPPDEAARKQAELEQQNAAQNQGNVFYFKEGENKFLKEYEMNVTFKKMLEDSRCPKDVNCIWEGVATAEVEVMGLATRPVTLKISTMNDARRGYSKQQEFNGYKISLAEVSPETTSAKGFNSLKGSYKIGLQFQKSENSPTQQGGTTTK